MPNPEFEQALLNYKNQHQSVGCKLTHCLGVPLIALSLPLILLNFRRGLTLFAAGWALQFIGHYCFERNNPVVLSPSRSFLVPFVAIFAVYQYWRDIISGNFFIEEKNGHEHLNTGIN